MKPEQKLWKWFSLYIRARDGYQCMLHLTAHKKGIILPMKCNGVMQCCHKISRSKASVKYDEINVFCGCSGSNAWANFNQDDWREICLKLWKEDMEVLDVKKRMLCKRKKVDFMRMAEYYKER